MKKYQMNIKLFYIRGLYFEKKEQLSLLKAEGERIEKNIYKKYNLKIKDIYNLLKNYEQDKFFRLINSRKDLFLVDNEINNISNRCDINILNMCNLYIKNM